MAVNTVAASAAPQITGAIRQAAHSTGISFEYLLTTAQIESNLNPAAQASTSSAKGLYQFIEQTWLATMKGDGPAHGYGSYAEGIFRGSDGHYEVPNPVLRAAIMRLRSDPTASAMMAGAFARNNAAQLRAAIGRDPTEGELYIAHFLGSDGAGKLIGAASTQPRANAAELFPQAAAANRSIFFDSSGAPRSVSGVYAKLTSRFEVARAVSFAPALPTADKPAVTPAASPAAPAASPDTAGVTQALAAANDGLPPLPDTRPLFQAMFTDRARAAVAPAVSSLWAPAKTETPGAPEPVRSHNLFTDRATDTRKLFGGNT